MTGITSLSQFSDFSPGEAGLLLRREGTYSSNLFNWRKQLRAVAQAATAK